jgi:hypothetical protein
VPSINTFLILIKNSKFDLHVNITIPLIESFKNNKGSFSFVIQSIAFNAEWTVKYSLAILVVIHFELD